MSQIDKVCLDSAEEDLHLFGTICFKGVLLMSPSSSSDFNFLLFAFYTTSRSVVHVFTFKSKNINSCRKNRNHTGKPMACNNFN